MNFSLGQDAILRAVFRVRPEAVIDYIYTFYTYYGNKKLNKFLTNNLTLLLFFLLGACDGRTISWQEEVKLSNGKIIVADQKRICTKANTGGLSSDCLARKAWLTFNLPGFSSAPIKWHEHLIPMVLNISDGKLYLIAYPPSFKEFMDYGAGQHAYFGFVVDLHELLTRPQA